jgi:protein-tyrosine phosphatase
MKYIKVCRRLINYFVMKKMFLLCLLIIPICGIDAQIREIPLQGTYNFRDIGGLRTKDGKSIKWGKIYRSALLQGLTIEDQQVLEALKIKKIIDFRGPIEIKYAPDKIPVGVCYLELSAGSVSDTPDNWADMAKDMKKYSEVESDKGAINYYKNIGSFKDRYKPLFDALLAMPQDSALVFHCMGGKDRTGIAAALIEYAFGVSWDQIIEDYLLSNRYRKRYNAEIATLLVKKYGVPQKRANTYGLAKPEFLEATFDEIKKKYGTVDNYLKVVMELDNQKISRLKVLYLQ